jgi:hypothetical protein
VELKTRSFRQRFQPQTKEELFYGFVQTALAKQLIRIKSKIPITGKTLDSFIIEVAVAEDRIMSWDETLTDSI